MQKLREEDVNPTRGVQKKNTACKTVTNERAQDSHDFKTTIQTAAYQTFSDFFLKSFLCLFCIW